MTGSMTGAALSTVSTCLRLVPFSTSPRTEFMAAWGGERGGGSVGFAAGFARDMSGDLLGCACGSLTDGV
eukprot:2542335-Prymnesium_polylepis.1